MKLKDQVCSLELAKRLKELGVKQESYFWWIANPAPQHEDFWIGDINWYNEKNEYAECYSAYTVAELGEFLCEQAISFFDSKNWVCDDASTRTEAKTEADARAKMRIYLLENNLITL